MAKMRSALGQAHGLGSAREGAKAWWTLRIAAIPFAILVLWWVVETVYHSGSDYAGFVAWIGSPIPAVLMIAALALMFHHLSQGIQEVLEDYVHSEGLKIGAIIAVRFGSVLLALTGILAVLRIALKN